MPIMGISESVLQLELDVRATLYNKTAMTTSSINMYDNVNYMVRNELLRSDLVHVFAYAV